MFKRCIFFTISRLTFFDYIIFSVYFVYTRKKNSSQQTAENKVTLQPCFSVSLTEFNGKRNTCLKIMIEMNKDYNMHAINMLKLTENI